MMKIQKQKCPQRTSIATVFPSKKLKREPTQTFRKNNNKNTTPIAPSNDQKIPRQTRESASTKENKNGQRV
jgi:hypothetical protein